MRAICASGTMRGSTCKWAVVFSADCEVIPRSCTRLRESKLLDAINCAVLSYEAMDCTMLYFRLEVVKSVAYCRLVL